MPPSVSRRSDGDRALHRAGYLRSAEARSGGPATLRPGCAADDRLPGTYVRRLLPRLAAKAGDRVTFLCIFVTV